MNITQYSDRIFSAVCKYYRLHSKDPSLNNFNKVRAELLSLIRDPDVTVDDKAQRVMTYFVDDIFRFGSWPFREEWKKLPLETQLFYTEVGAADFYTILKAYMPVGGARRVDNNTQEMLEVFYKCLGFGFLGMHRMTTPHTGPEKARELMETLAGIIGVSAKIDAPVLESAYETDDYDYFKPPSRHMRWVVAALVVCLIASVAAYFVTFYSAQSELTDELTKITAAAKP